MREARFDLKARSGGTTHHPQRWREPDARMVDFDMIALRDGKPLGGHNVQVQLGTGTWSFTPDDADLWLGSAWWVRFRNQFAQAPDVSAKIVASVEQELSEITSELEVARGPEMVAVRERLWATTFPAHGPDYWR
jgi:hypothetical protein